MRYTLPLSRQISIQGVIILVSGFIVSGVMDVVAQKKTLSPYIPPPHKLTMALSSGE
jgi:hypothetical protein